MTLSQPSSVRYEARFVPKKPEGFCFLITMSLGPGVIAVTISLPSTSPCMVVGASSRRVLFHRQLPASQLSAPLSGGIDHREPLGACRFYQLPNVFKSHPAFLATRGTPALDRLQDGFRPL